MRNLRISPNTSIYTIAFLFNLSVSLTLILIPLYGLALGYSITQIGILLSIPGIAQISLRLFAGVLSDYLGEKIMLCITFSSLVIAGFIFSIGTGYFWTLAMAQLFMGISRSIYWPISQSYASRISAPVAPNILGSLNSFGFIGQILGFTSGGWIILNMGYIRAFGSVMLVGVLGLITIIFMPIIPKPLEKKDVSMILKHIPEMIQISPFQFALINAFFAGLIYALTASFFPVWLKTLGYSEGLVGSIMTVKLIGSVAAGTIFGVLLKKIKFLYLLQSSLLGSGICFLLVAVSLGPISIVILNICLGFFAGVVTISYQTFAVLNSSEDSRGIVLSTVGLGWALAFFIGPVLFGWVIDTVNVYMAFNYLGIILSVISLFLRSIYNYFMRREHSNNRSA